MLGRSLDELPPQTRRFLLILDELTTKICAERALDRSDFRFTRREAREYSGWGYTQTKVHLERLVELELVSAHRAGRGQDFYYELRYDGRGKDGEPFLTGLIDVDFLIGESTYDASTAGQTPSTAAPLRPESGASAVPLRPLSFASELNSHGPLSEKHSAPAPNADQAARTITTIVAAPPRRTHGAS